MESVCYPSPEEGWGNTGALSHSFALTIVSVNEGRPRFGVYIL